MTPEEANIRWLLAAVLHHEPGQSGWGRDRQLTQRRLPAAGCVAPHDLRRRTGRHAAVRQATAHHRARGDGDVAADAGARQHDHVGAEPRSRADHDRILRGPLPADRRLDVRVHVVLVGHVHVRAERDVVADLDRLVPDDVATPPDRAPGTDADHRVVRHGLARRHPGGEAHVRADQRLRADVDPLLAEDRARREGDHAAWPHRPEAPASFVVGRDRSDVADPSPHPLDQAGRQIPGSRRQLRWPEHRPDRSGITPVSAHTVQYRSRPMQRWVGILVAALVVLAGCTGDGGSPTAQSTAGVFSSGRPVASATVGIQGDQALSSAFTQPDVRCSFPDVNGPSIALLSTPTGLVFRIKIQSGKVTVLVSDNATPTPHERDFDGTGVATFDPATGASVDSTLTEIPTTAGSPGDIGQLTTIKASVDCAGQDPGASTLTLTGDTPQGSLANARTRDSAASSATRSATRCRSSGSSPLKVRSSSSSSGSDPTA